MSKDVATLVQLGLNEKQATIYLALHQLGEASAYKVAEFSGLKRPTVYVILDELRQLELVVKVPYAKAQVFRTKPLMDFVERHATAVQQGYDLASSLRTTQASSTNPVLFYEGLSGVANAVNYKVHELEGGRSSAILGHLSDEQLIPVFTKWHEVANEYKRFTWRGLISGEQVETTFAALKEFRRTSSYINTRVLPETVLPQDFSFEVFDRAGEVEYLRIIADKALQATIIETPVVGTGFLKLFDALWDQSEAVIW